MKLSPSLLHGKLLSSVKEKCLSTMPFLWFAIALTSIFSLCILYSPAPFDDGVSVLRNSSSYGQQEEVAVKKCDLFRGHWIPDMEGSSYTNSSCRTIPSSKNCFKNGRMDTDFLNWRWKPDDCELQRFDPLAFLDIVKGKRMAFIGDSVARNQMESLLCLLSQADNPVDIFKDSEDRFRTWYFPNYDFTLEMLWSKFLVHNTEQITNGSSSGSGVYELHFDKIDKNWAARIPALDYAIISSAHWFFRKLYMYEGGNITGCVYCEDLNIVDHGVEFTVKMAVRSALNHIRKCKECRHTRTFLRTFSPAHFENGTWDNGGSCKRTYPQNEIAYAKLENSWEWRLRSIQVKEMEKIRKPKEGRKRFTVLDITTAMLMRPDGHPGSHWDNQWMKGYNDCVHWCLPGPVDMWNDLLLAALQNEVSLDP